MSGWKECQVTGAWSPVALHQRLTRWSGIVRCELRVHVAHADTFTHVPLGAQPAVVLLPFLPDIRHIARKQLGQALCL